MAQPIFIAPSDTYYVSPDGSDKWSGIPAERVEEGPDGPFATVQHALRVVRAVKASGRMTGPVRILLKGGRHRLESPIVITPADSGPITIASAPGEQAVLDGGDPIEGWEETEVNGVTAWVADAPRAEGAVRDFRQLWVNGRRATRARLPKEGLYRLTDVPGMPVPAGWGRGGYRRFALDEMQDYRNIEDIDVVMYHFWIDERLPVAHFDPETKMITSARLSRAPLVEAHGTALAPCFIENVFEALREPGEWYLDRAAGKVYYVPRDGETLDGVDAHSPRLMQLVRFAGDPENGRYVEFIRFENVAFEHTDWRQPGDDVPDQPALWEPVKRLSSYRFREDRGSSAQGAADLPGVISLWGARYCAIEDCRVAHAGFYAVDVMAGCHGCRVVGNELTDLGGGGVKINGAAFAEAPALRTGNIRVTDNHIHVCGRVFHSGIGILSMHAFQCTLSHNHIHDLYYSGISCGWVWGYAANISRDNRIEYNHIHDLGHGLLSDMGGIYTLGVQPGTVLRYNRIHDVEKLNYGAWCIYPDEGSSHLLIENNVCYRTNGEIFHQHYGRENVVRNNIFAFGGEACAAHGRADAEHRAFTFEKNIFCQDGAPMWMGGYGAPLAMRNHISDHNLLWDAAAAGAAGGAGTGPDAVGEGMVFTEKRGTGATVELAGWRELGHDVHSIVADPKFADPTNDDFALAEDSPALEIGFEPIDLTGLGPRAGGDRD